MKQFLLAFLIILFFAAPVKSQKIHFTDSANHWKGIRTDEGFPQVPYSWYRWELTAGHDTTYNGQTYRIITGSAIYPKALVREDTFAGKVYIRLLNPIYIQDTAEQVLYDYNLVPGDTLYTHMNGYQFACKVSDTNTVTIDSRQYRVQHFTPAPNMGFGQPYYVIEGIGCITAPFFPLTPAYEFGLYLCCFYNNGTQPVVTPAVSYSFDNDQSCALNVTNPLPAADISTVSPNPVHASAIISFAKEFSGTLQLYGIDGRLYKTIPTGKTRQISINCSDLTPGIYFILSQSAQSKLIDRQKLIVQ